MKKIFLAPRSNETAYKNYISSMSGRRRDEIIPHLSDQDVVQLGDRERFFIWACQPSLKNRWSQLEFGDYVIFYSRGKFISIGELLFKTENKELARVLWPVSKTTGEPWTCLFFVDNVRNISLSLEDFNEMTGYHLRVVQGFMQVSTAMEHILKKYGSTDNFVKAMETGLVKAEASELFQLSEVPSSKITKEEVSRIDALTRGKTEEEIETALKQYAIDALHKTPEQVTRTVKSYKRNRKLVSDMKARFKNKCQICGFTFKTASGFYYSEAAHVIPISSGQEGVDTPDNIWILCANHHRMLDTGAIQAVSTTEYTHEGKKHSLATI